VRRGRVQKGVERFVRCIGEELLNQPKWAVSVLLTFVLDKPLVRGRADWGGVIDQGGVDGSSRWRASSCTVGRLIESKTGHTREGCAWGTGWLSGFTLLLHKFKSAGSSPREVNGFFFRGQR
jgi:hypothetical protein